MKLVELSGSLKAQATVKYSMDQEPETLTQLKERGQSEILTNLHRRYLSPHADLVAEMTEFIARNPQIVGGVDILNIHRFHPLERAGILSMILTRIVTVHDEKPVVRAIVVITVPETDIDVAHARALEAVSSTFQLLNDQEMPSHVEDHFKADFKVISAPDLGTRSLVDIIAAQPEHTAVIVTNAASYRDERTQPYIAPGEVTALLPQDIWVPQLHALASEALEIARKHELYVALDTGQLSPTRTALHQLLLSIAGCGVMGSSSNQDLWPILAESVGRWDQWIREGSLGKTLREIRELPQAFDVHKPFLRIQMLHRAGFSNQSLEAIREELTRGYEIDASMRVKLARIAQDANASNLASEVLSPAVDQLDSLEDLESALATSHDSGDGELEELIASRLTILFPNSSGIRARKRRSMMAARDYGGIAEMLISQGDDPAGADFFRELARYLSAGGTPDYFGLINSARKDVGLAEAFRMACVRDALQRHLIVHAFDLALPIPETPQQAKRGERLLMEILEAAFLWAKKGVLPLSYERIEMAVLALVERLASDPTNQGLRLNLARLVQPSISGSTGLAMMANVAFKLASRPIAVTKRKVRAEKNMEWLHQQTDFVKTAFGWLKGQEPVVIGRIVMPDTLLTQPADDVIAAIRDYLNFAPISAADDIAPLQSWLALATSITPHGTDPDFDIQLMRLVGGKLASSGYTQVARDLVEQTLVNGAGTPQRRRLGWFAMADVYQRCQNRLEGLLALACAFAADDTADEEQVWYETHAVARFFRDCGLYVLARTAIGQFRQQYAGTGLLNQYGHRLDTIEIQIRQYEFNYRDVSNTELEALIADAIKNGLAILERHDETAPAAAVVGQLLNLGKKHGTSIPPNAEAVLAQLCDEASGNLATFARMLSNDSISANDLFDFAKVRAGARYSDDVGYDMYNVAIVAGRALADDRYIQDPVQTSFALELIADHGVAIPRWDEAAAPPPAPECVEQPAEIARAVSCEGLSVVPLGFDANGRLVRVSTVGGDIQMPVREPDDIIHEERFKAWASEFPYRYGIDESSTNLFYTTTADLRLSELPDGPIVVVADATLQLFPPNIFFLGDDFSGRTRPMAAVPSLAWLSAARQKETLGDGRLFAWISTAGDGLESQTLPMLAQRLEPTLTEHGFTIDNGATLPQGFAGATMAIITAHGSIHHEERFFQVVSDEGVLRVTPGALAGALRNVGIVVLFVCSGGRADKHPGAHTTLGLATRILDRGSQAVVASPWPLESRVPSHWLPVFLEHWSRGETLINANFAANKFVDDYFSLDPAKGLAMTVLGNPIVRRM